MAERIAIVRPAVENLNTKRFNRSPAVTESRLGAAASRTKCDSFSVRSKLTQVARVGLRRAIVHASTAGSP